MTGQTNSVKKASDELDTEIYINCFLANKEIRNGYLFQTIDHKEYSPKEPKTKKILLLVKKHFKNLNHLPFYQGVLLSRNVYKKELVENDSELGKILGFPCKCPEYPSKKTRYGYDIVVVLKSSCPELENNNTYNKTYNIISFMSLDATHQTQTDIIKNILLNDDSFELRSRVVDVKLVISTIYTESYFIDALLQPDYNFTEDELYELTNIWYNHIGETHLDEFKNLLDDNTQLINPINRGIILGILLFSENNAESVFYPIQNNGVIKLNKYDKIKVELETRMIEILKKPKQQYINKYKA
jgi:hypothetical protein